jgi:hypothetical protein
VRLSDAAQAASKRIQSCYAQYGLSLLTFIDFPFPTVSISLLDNDLWIGHIVSLLSFLDNWFLLFYIFRRRIVGYAGGLYERKSTGKTREAISGYGWQADMGNPSP